MSAKMLAVAMVLAVLGAAAGSPALAESEGQQRLATDLQSRAVQQLMMSPAADPAFGAPPAANGCFCNEHQYMCGCCEHIEVKDLHINDTICVNITAIVSTLSLNIVVTLDGKVIFNDTESLENPDVCFGIPYIKKEAEICLDFYNMTISSKDVGGCVKVQIKVFDITVLDENIGCFNIPLFLLDSGTQRPSNSVRQLAQTLLAQHKFKVAELARRKQAPVV